MRPHLVLVKSRRIVLSVVPCETYELQQTHQGEWLANSATLAGRVLLEDVGCRIKLWPACTGERSAGCWVEAVATSRWREVILSPPAWHALHLYVA